MKRKFLVFLLMLSVLSSTIAFSPLWASAANSGTCGDGVTWTLSNSQVLTISGNGKMDDYCYCTPWAGIKKVIIKGGVQNIGKAVFRKHPYLTSVEIGDSVTHIGDEAFRDCPKLESVKMGKGVKTIGQDAFGFCEKLTNIELPLGLTTIGYRAFMFTSIESLKIPDTVTKIDTSAFQTCQYLKSVVIPDSVTEIGYGAFSHCTGLISVKIGSGVTDVNDEAFYGCTGLKSVELSKNVKFISSFAFYECDSLKDIYYGGSESEWNKVYIGEENSCLTKAKVHYGKKAPQTVSVQLNGKDVEFDVLPQIINGRTMVPIRVIFEAMGATVSWDQSTASVTCKKGRTTVKMKVDSTDLYVNNTKKQMDIAPVIVDGRTLAPARFVAEAFGAKVGWDGETNTVTISSK